MLIDWNICNAHMVGLSASVEPCPFEVHRMPHIMILVLTCIPLKLKFPIYQIILSVQGSKGGLSSVLLPIKK